MLSGRAFRAQLVMKGQRELFDYWRAAAGARPMPARSDLDPLRVPRLLPSIGLIDLRNGLDEASFRLAGTRLHEIYGQEITGKRAGDVFTGESGEYWRRIHERVIEAGRPLNGVVRGPAKGRDFRRMPGALIGSSATTWRDRPNGGKPSWSPRLSTSRGLIISRSP